MPNHLSKESSLYLQQHASNPVDWYPWGEEALTLARAQGKPILLSIGYSACHWCHVMAHESFEDEQTAALMNTHFINIKVDREERPDLDQIYQTAHYMLTRRNGGWPLTMFLAPDQTPFFGGTYFPRTARYQLPGFAELIPRIAGFYQERGKGLGTQNASLLQAFESTLPHEASGSAMDAAPLLAAQEELEQSFDHTWGGFGGAPKFPHPTDLEFCLRRHAASGDATPLEMAMSTLRAMAAGGIYDQLGGGFCRYSVDQYWAIPHFEKMLYDNGPLLALYSDAWAISGEPRFQEVVEETAAWVQREMQSPEGGYYATLDADSEHEEGKFYVWTPAEVAGQLGPDEYAVAAAHYGLDQAPNFEGKHWHLNVHRELPAVAEELGIPTEAADALLASAKAKLFAAREKRVHPGRDEKTLVSWNALMIKGMARAARVFRRPDWLASARAAVDFIHRTMWRNGRLLAVHKDRQARLNAYLDDYAFLLDALLEFLQSDFRAEDLEFARDIADVLLTQFEDQDRGGFFFTSHDHERLIHRPKPGYDNATPSGNGVAAFALQRLGHILGNSDYLAAAERALRLFYTALEQQPGGFKSLLFALEEFLVPPRIVVLRGPGPALVRWTDALPNVYQPRALTLAIPNGARDLPETLRKPETPAVNAWVCQGVKCLPPVDDLTRLKTIFKGGEFV